MRDLIAGAIADRRSRRSLARAGWRSKVTTTTPTSSRPTPTRSSPTTSSPSHPAGTPLGDVLAAGGVRAMIEAAPIAPGNPRRTSSTVLNDTYADYDVEAGLRFRSSSSVEDIEGFNGAGLYTSYTGYLRPGVAGRRGRPRQHDRAGDAAGVGFVLELRGVRGAGIGRHRPPQRRDGLDRPRPVRRRARAEQRRRHVHVPAGRRPDDAVVEINVQADRSR